MAFRIGKRGQFGLVAAASVLATLGAGGLAMAATDTRIASEQLGRFGDADLNNDGKITRGEWLRAAANRFAAIDVDHNGALVESELPPPPRPGRHHRHGPDADGPPPPPGPVGDQDDEWGPPATPPAVQPAAAQPAAAQPAVAQPAPAAAPTR